VFPAENVLRAALASHLPARGKRYSPALKARVIEFAQSRRREGASWERIADDIGVSFETVRRWCLARSVGPLGTLPNPPHVPNVFDM
jgi:transposase-like protein